MNEARAEELGRSVHHWLEFQVACRREMLLSEAYLAQPTGEFLRAHHSGDIKSEWTIPALRTGKSGRPRQLDYVLLSRDSGRLTAAIEAKWIRSVKDDPQRIVDDLLRLECTRSGVIGQSVNRYFLVAGRANDFQSSFLDMKVQDSGLKHFLPPLLDCAANTKKVVRVDSSTGPWRRFFKNFGKEYGVRLPTSFFTKRLVDIPGGEVRLALWRVASSPGHGDIDPSLM